PRPYEPYEPADVEWRILRKLGYEGSFLRAARTTASQYGLTLAEELIRTGHLDARIWWQAVADHLRISFYPSAYLQPMPATASLPSF
ncbi:hypothetical protein ABTF75_19050, partial [Acinetobacter baumannii]